MTVFSWWKVCTSLSQQIKILLAVLKQILLFLGWCHDFSVLFQWWEQRNLVNVQAVLKVTSLLFKLSILGLNYFTTFYYKQEEGINTWKKMLDKTNVFHTWGSWSMSRVYYQGQKDFLADPVLQIGHYGALLWNNSVVSTGRFVLTAQPNPCEFKYWRFSYLEDLGYFCFQFVWSTDRSCTFFSGEDGIFFCILSYCKMSLNDTLIPVCNGVNCLFVSWDGQENECFTCTVCLCFLQCFGAFFLLA